MLYLLIIAPICFRLRSWPSSGSLQVFRRVPQMRQRMWYRSYIYY